MTTPSVAFRKEGVSVVIPTFQREGVLLDTVRLLLPQLEDEDELILVDQSPAHDATTEAALAEWEARSALRWVRLDVPSTTRAMNIGLRVASRDIVLFLDDDIVPSGGLLRAHEAAYAANPRTWAVVGRVLQPGEVLCEDGVCRPRHGLRGDLGFRFSSQRAGWVTNVIACNLSVLRDRAMEAGGFDMNFTPPVAYRFETEFAKRLIDSGGGIQFEPTASINHLRASSGGTRSRGSHLVSVSPVHGVGDYYYALLCGRGWERIFYILRRPFREIRTKFHLLHPWWIPVKFIGEIRAIAAALRLYRRKPGLLSIDDSSDRDD